MNKKYSLGLDYGTQSARAVLVDVSNGEEIATSVMPYKHGVMDAILPVSKEKLPEDFALQDPDDYIEALIFTIKDAIKKANVNKEDIIGIGVDFTACTMMPIKEDGTVLCQLDEYKNNPHAYVKLWKHHAAQEEAHKINKLAKERNEEFINKYAGKVSSEWLFPKIMEILNKAPEIYEECDRFIEAADFIVLKLTGNITRNSCCAGYKAFYSKKDGYPSKDFFKALDERLENVIEEKLPEGVLPLGSSAGNLNEEMAEILGLSTKTKVAVGNIDAHAAVPAVNILEPSKMLMIMGTSTCHMVLSKEEKIISGVAGVVEDGMVPGFYGYEAGQSAVGDIFEWFVKNNVPASYEREAQERNINIHSLLEEKASKLKIGENGLIALDWWNGNRSTLMDADLTGILLGYTLRTKPEEVYRALIESTAFGTKMIIDAFEKGGIEVKELYACGGLPEKNKMLMQIYADVTNLPIRISDLAQPVAVGSAIYGAVVAGKENGGYDSLIKASENMARLKEEAINPIEENVKKYAEIFEEYKILYKYFGTGKNNVMKHLKKIKQS